ncbi:MAG: sporulation protein YqfD [Clostridia bacterium]|nr:sporulation protein YqfD [Clostridia bacterium]
MFFLRERIRIWGTMPERALLRLKRAGISAYKAKKTQKNCIELDIKRKDVEKVFAIFPRVCYNKNANTTYSAEKLGSVGAAKWLGFFKNRTGFLLGALLFAGISLYADTVVFGIDFIGSSVYAREAEAALEAYGIKPFARYKTGSEDLIAAKLLRLDSVEYCSVQKRGHRVCVEMRLTDFYTPEKSRGDMVAARSGTLLALTVLKGTPLKSVGDEVKAGETLVGGYVETANGERTETLCIARVRIACTYEALVEAADEEAAFAKAYLEIDGDISQKEISPKEGGYHVTIRYIYSQTINY